MRGIYALALLPLLVSTNALADKACDAAYDQAQTLRDAKKLTLARDQLRVCARSTCAASIAKDCATWLAEVDALIPSVVVFATDAAGAMLPDVSVATDGGALRKVDGTPWDVDPGTHTFTFVAADGTKTDKAMLVVAGQRGQKIATTLVGAPVTSAAAPPPPQAAAASTATPSDAANARHGRRVIGIAVGGAGLASVVVGAVFGGLTFSAASSAKSACPSSMNCNSTATSDRSTAITFSTVSDIGWIAGGVLVATGVTLYLTAPNDTGPKGASTGLTLTPGGIAVTGRF